jgi:hypothetical protein
VTFFEKCRQKDSMAFSESASKKIPWHLLKVPAILTSGIFGSALKYN